jgi:ATP-dependent DNA helicase RecG
VSLHEELTYIKGVGPKKAIVLAEHGIKTVADILEFYPRRYIDRTSVTQVSEIETDSPELTIVGRVLRVEVKGFRRKQRFEATLHDGSGLINLVWFNRVSWIRKFLKAGEIIAASGKPTFYRGWQLQHPAIEKLSFDEDVFETDDEGTPLTSPSDEFRYEGQIVPIYPGTEELKRAWLDSRGIAGIVRNVYRKWEINLSDFLPASILKYYKLTDLTTAQHDVHLGKTLDEVFRARRRLIFQEFFILELMLAFRKTSMQKCAGQVSHRLQGKLVDRMMDLLPFDLTLAQKRVIDEILCDMAHPSPMNRLLQGDVGSGKTLVALFAILVAVENDRQGALMAPTEILAEQHFRNIIKYADELGIRVTLLTGSRKGEARRKALEEIKSGWAQIVIGTHALFQESVDFAGLGLVVIDEQHRFGVEQRASFRAKAPSLDTLVMTATPIPRTMAIVSYGDMDLSIIDELPPGRIPVTTAWRRETKRAEIFKFVNDQIIENDAQAYIVYPLIEESAKMDLRAAENAAIELQEGWLKACRIGLLHGRLKPQEKNEIMQRFLRGEVQALISTTVIEVGVDNPKATIMVVEQAERFGLSQLHQLRGRVGRGADKSWCVLVAGKELSKEGRERLDTMARTSDGFEIAEVDMRMRGTGDFFGTRQSGLPELKIADIMRDTDLLLQARDAAFSLIEKDPGLDNHPTLKEYLIDKHGDQMARVEN